MERLYSLLCLHLFVLASGLDIPFDAGEYEIDGDITYNWRSPSPYPVVGADLVVRTWPGYMVQVTVRSLELDGALGDYLLIKSGGSLDDDRTGRVFTHHLRSERAFVSLTPDVFFRFAVLGTNEDNLAGFSVDIQRFGDTPPTTPPPSNDTIFPTPPADGDPGYITPNIGGRRPQEYLNNTADFEEAVARMATEYCDTNNIHLAEAITKENVRIEFIMRCPVTWRDSDDCVRIRFAIPVFLDEPSSDRYELTADNLGLMWSKLSDKYLEEIGLANFIPQDTEHIILIWLVTICLAILLFGVVIYVTKAIAYRRLKANKKPREFVLLSEDDKQRPSNESLGPHPLQSVPNLFEPEFRLYEPELAPRYASGVSEAELDMQQFTTFSKEERKNSTEI